MSEEVKLIGFCLVLYGIFSFVAIFAVNRKLKKRLNRDKICDHSIAFSVEKYFPLKKG